MPPSAKELRKAMIEGEMGVILKATRDFVQTHLDEDDLDDEAIKALHLAAMKLAYRKTFYDVMKDKIMYVPSCSKLILSKDLIEEAERYYYDEDDEFPPEYCKALRSVVFASMNGNVTNDEDPDSSANAIDDEEFMEKLATEWTDALLDDDDYNND